MIAASLVQEVGIPDPKIQSNLQWEKYATEGRWKPQLEEWFTKCHKGMVGGQEKLNVIKNEFFPTRYF